MEEEKLNKLRGYYHAFLSYQQVLEEAITAGHITIASSAFRPLAHEIYGLQFHFSDVPTFIENDLLHPSGGYDAVGLRGYLAMVLGKLKAAIDIPENSPVTEQREFSFIKEAKLREIIERDYIEIQRAYVAQCWKSVIILSGSAIEAILLDLLRQNQSNALAASKAPQKESDITKWPLSDLINIAVELQLVSSSVEKLSHSIREYRNLIHPGNEIRTGNKFGGEEARIALEMVNMVHRDLSSQHSS